MIRKIWLREYGPFREAEFSLSPLTVLVGPNASGKTMAMEALLRVKGVLDEATADIYRRDESQPDPEALERVTRKFFRSYGRMTPTHENRFIAFDRGSCFVFSERGKTPLEPEEVRLTGFLEDGSATICELSDHPEFERWKDVMSPGEFWSTAGEDWIRDARK